MKKVYLVTVPPKQQGMPAEMVVCDSISSVIEKYPYFIVQQIDYIIDSDNE